MSHISRLLLAAFVLVHAGGLSAQTPKQKPGPAARATALVRIVCVGTAEGADLSVNGVAKGPCPLDVEVPAGSVKIHASRLFDAYTENSRDIEFTIGGDVIKRVIIEWTEPTRYTEAGLARARQQRAEREAAEAISNEAASRAEAAAKASAWLAEKNRFAEQSERMMASVRAQRQNSQANCPDCPAPILGKVATVPALPASSDSELQSWLDRARAELAEFSASGGLSMQPPPIMNPLPCAGIEPAMRKLANFEHFSEMSPEEQARYRAQSTDKVRFVDRYVDAVRIWPVQAACVDGVLDGPLDVWIFANEIENLGDTIITTPRLAHVRATMKAGRVDGPLFQSMRKREGMMAPMPNAARPFKLAPDDTFWIYYAYPREAAKDAYLYVWITRAMANGTDVKRSAIIHLRQNLPGGGSQSFSYSDNRLTNTGMWKDAFRHGPSTAYSYDAAGRGLPAVVTCYSEGKVIAADPCPLP